MQCHSIFVFTHDSIGVGEDGPTHQPVEQVMSLRAIPGLIVIRPADANETAAAWRVALQRKGPVALALTRQKLPTLDAQTCPIAAGVPRGAYTLADADSPNIIIIATGSEVQWALGAKDELEAKGIRARVVSMPSWELFAEQGDDYRRQVLPPGLPKLAVEAGVTMGWRGFVGCRGDVIGIDRFGASAPGNVVMDELGFSVENVVSRALKLLGR